MGAITKLCRKLQETNRVQHQQVRAAELHVPELEREISDLHGRIAQMELYEAKMEADLADSEQKIKSFEEAKEQVSNSIALLFFQ